MKSNSYDGMAKADRRSLRAKRVAAIIPEGQPVGYPTIEEWREALDKADREEGKRR